MKMPEFKPDKIDVKNLESIRDEVTKLKAEVAKLKRENESLKKEIQKINSQKVSTKHVSEKVKLLDLIDTFGSIVSEVRGNYAVSKIDVELSAQVEGDGTLRIVPPDAETKTPQAIDKIRLSIKPILFSKKKDLIEVPRVVGLELSEAKKVVEESGLSVGKIAYKKSLSKKGVVITQYPESECLVEKDIKVDLTVSG